MRKSGIVTLVLALLLAIGAMGVRSKQSHISAQEAAKAKDIIQPHTVYKLKIRPDFTSSAKITFASDYIGQELLTIDEASEVNLWTSRGKPRARFAAEEELSMANYEFHNKKIVALSRDRKKILTFDEQGKTKATKKLESKALYISIVENVVSVVLDKGKHFLLRSYVAVDKLTKSGEKKFAKPTGIEEIIWDNNASRINFFARTKSSFVQTIVDATYHNPNNKPRIFTFSRKGIDDAFPGRDFGSFYVRRGKETSFLKIEYNGKKKETKLENNGQPRFFSRHIDLIESKNERLLPTAGSRLKTALLANHFGEDLFKEINEHKDFFALKKATGRCYESIFILDGKTLRQYSLRTLERTDNHRDLQAYSVAFPTFKVNTHSSHAIIRDYAGPIVALDLKSGESKTLAFPASKIDRRVDLAPWFSSKKPHILVSTKKHKKLRPFAIVSCEDGKEVMREYKGKMIPRYVLWMGKGFYTAFLSERRFIDSSGKIYKWDKLKDGRLDMVAELDLPDKDSPAWSAISEDKKRFVRILVNHRKAAPITLDFANVETLKATSRVVLENWSGWSDKKERLPRLSYLWGTDWNLNRILFKTSKGTFTVVDVKSKRSWTQWSDVAKGTDPMLTRSGAHLVYLSKTGKIRVVDSLSGKLFKELRCSFSPLAFTELRTGDILATDGRKVARWTLK